MSENTEFIPVSDEVIGVCAVNATLKTEGVSRMAGGFTDALRGNFLGKEALSKGIRVNQEKGTVELDVHVIAAYCTRIPQMAWEIQENVKNEIRTMTGLKVTAVNIHVQGVETNDTK